MTKNKSQCLTKYILQGGFGGTPTADSRFAVPCPSDRNALRNPPRQHVPTVTSNVGQPNSHSNINRILRRKLTKDIKTISSCQKTTESSEEATNGNGLYLYFGY